MKVQPQSEKATAPTREVAGDTALAPTRAVAGDQSSSRQRVQLDFSAEAYNRLKQLRERSDARTNAELVRNALRLYEWYLNTKDERYRIHLVRDNEVKEVEIIF